MFLHDTQFGFTDYDLIEQTFKWEETLYLAINDNKAFVTSVYVISENPRNVKKAFFTSTDYKRYKLWSCQNVCGALSYLY